MASERPSFEEFINDNKETIHCLAMNAADVLFSAAAAVKSFGEPGPSWWVVYANAVEATAQLYGCLAPPREIYEEAFEGQNKRCQCATVGGQLFLEWLDAAGNRTTLSNSELIEAKEIKDAVIAEGIASCNWVSVEGENRVATYDIEDGSQPIWFIVPTLNTDCCSGTISPPSVQPPPPPYEFPMGNPSCKTEVELIDSCIDKYGLAQNFYRVTLRYWQSDIPEPGCGSSGSRYYWETINGPYIYFGPYYFEGFSCTPRYAPPHPDAPEPGSIYTGGKTGLSAVTYTLDAGCTYNQETEDFDTKFTYDVEATSDGIVGLARRMDALAWMINNSGLIPFTTCATTRPELEGQWVSTHWVSDGISDGGTKHLRKLFRYRTKSERTTDQLQQHWKQLIWEAGPVLVGHKGAWWGTPQVWALNEEEGKRVIRFAGGEAGIDPDLDGEWVVGSSSSPRIGMIGTMRLAKPNGEYYVSKRDGSDGYPV